MKKLLLIILISLSFTTADAQDRNIFIDVKNIDALKIAFITRQLNLTPEEAQKFWPVHNLYFEELKKARKDNLENELVYEEIRLNIRKKYNTEFKKILMSDERVNKLYQSEKDFNNEVRKELKNRMMNNPNFKKRIQQNPIPNKND